MHIIIRRPKKEDISKIKEVFQDAISYAFKADWIADRKNDIIEEVEKQLCCLQSDFDSNWEKTYYLIAEVENQIIGTIAYESQLTDDDFVRKNLNFDLKSIPEITSVYVLSDFQGKWIGSLLFNSILLVLTGKGIRGICMDGGYQKSIQFWTRKIGIPDTILKNYWGEGLNQVFWYRDIKDIKIQYATR